MHRLFFWNAWHNGDILFTRPLVRAVLARHDVAIAWGCFHNHRYLIEDLPVQILTDPRDDRRAVDLSYLCPADHVPINTWLGQYPDARRCIWESVVTTYNRQVSAHGLAHLCLTADRVPMVDLPDRDLPVRTPAIYVTNGAARSGQSEFAMNMPRLAQEFPSLTFYCTAAPGAVAPNLVDCSAMNMVELAAVSNRCDAIIGRPGGALDCAFTETNRFKPRAVMGLQDPYNPTVWDYPGILVHLLHSHDDLRQFLQGVHARPGLRATAGFNSPPYRPAPPAPQPLLARVESAIQRLQQQPDEDAKNDLLAARWHVARLWAQLPPENLAHALTQEAGKVYQHLLSFRMGPTFSAEMRITLPMASAAQLPDEWQWARQLVSSPHYRPGHPESLPHLMAAMLYLDALEMPLWPDLRTIPPWFRWDYLDYLLCPSCFSRPGDADAQARVWQATMHSLLENLQRQPDDPQWHDAAACFLKRANFDQLPASSHNLVDLARQRARLLEIAVAPSGTSLDHAFPPPPATPRRLRVGFLVQHLASQPATFASSFPNGEINVTARAFFPMNLTRERAAADLCRRLDPTLWDATLYCVQPVPESQTKATFSGIPRALLLPLDLPSQVQAIRQDDLDVLVFASSVTDAATHTALLALHRLARRHVALDLHGVTTGMRHMDYALVGDLVPSAPHEFTERLLPARGPGASRIPAAVQGPPQTGSGLVGPRRAQEVRFLSFTPCEHLTPELLTDWATMLQRVPHAILLLGPMDLGERLVFPVNAFVELTQRIFSQIPGPPRAFILDPQCSPPQRRALLYETDVYLDAYPVSGFTHTIEALQAGLPVVTHTGKLTRSRTGAALLTELGLPELIAQNTDQYLDTAVRLGHDKAWRVGLTQRLGQAMARPPRFLDQPHMAAELDRLLRQICRQPAPRE